MKRKVIISMNITYTGKQELLQSNQQANIDAKFVKIAKLLDLPGKEDKQAHVILAHTKNQFRAEITMHYLDHTLVGEHIDADQFIAIHMALDKLEKQILKLRDKRRDVKKGARDGWNETDPADASLTGKALAELQADSDGRPKVYRVQPVDSKPMTLDEAVLVIESNDDYLVYRDANSNRPSVLLRRKDGNFDLVEC